MRIYVATSNQGKLRDFSFAAREFPGVTLEALPGVEEMPAPEETAATFEGNARIKAVAYSLAAPGRLVLADDSGLEVDALRGERDTVPGVRSARFADDRGFSTSRPLPADQRNNLCLLDALASTREADRTGRYRCVLALARNGVVIAAAAGSVEGEILAVPRGSGGFGYDPLFLLPDEGLTMAEVAPEDRHKFSHRGRALAALLGWLDGRLEIEVPMPIRTPRLEIRPRQPGDEAETLAAVKETWTELHQWMAWAEDLRDFTPEQQAARTQLVQEEFERREQFEFVGVEEATGQPVVWTGFHNIDWRARECETGFWVRKSAQNQGYATEATNALLRYAFGALGMRKVGITHAAGNTPSQRVVEKLGFAPAGILPDASALPGGRTADRHCYERADLEGLPELRVSWGG